MSDESDERTYHCPACKDDPALQEIVERDTPFLGCTQCFGLFSHEADLIGYVGRATQAEVVEAAEDLLRVAREGARGQGKRACPECEAPLQRMGFGESPFVILDRCPAEHGVWLDKKELKKVIRASRGHAVKMGLIAAFADDFDDEDEE